VNTTTDMIAAADYGLGLCLPCVLEHKGALAARAADKKAPPPKPPRFACTGAPLPYPVPAPGGGIAGIAGVVVPVCYDHAPSPGPQRARPPLLVAGGMPG